MTDSIRFAGIDFEWDDYCWRGFFDFWSGGEIEIRTVEEESILPSASQENAWLEFVGNKDTIYLSLLEAVFIYYQEIRPKYVAAGGKWATGMPHIESSSELKEMIRLQTINISPPYDGRDILIGLLFTCDWDSEHGLGVVLKNTNIEKVGGADYAVLL